MTAPEPANYAGRLVPALKALAAELTAAGIPTSLDRQTMRVPGAWVRPDTVTATSLAGDTGPARSRVSVLLACPTQGDAEALADLSRLLAKALTVIDPDEDVDTSVLLTIRSNTHPAFRLVVDLDF